MAAASAHPRRSRPKPQPRGRGGLLLVASPFRRVTFPLGVQWSCKPFGELAGHKHGLNFVEVPLTFDLWYPAGTPGARRASGGFEVLRWARGAPAWRPAQHQGFCAWIPARLPAVSPTLLCPWVASPRHPPSLAGSPLSGSSASPDCLPRRAVGAQGPGSPPATPMPRRAYSLAQHRNASYFIAVYRSQSMSPGRPPAPAPAGPESSAGGARTAAGPGPADAGVVAARATGGAISSPSRAGAAGKTAPQADGARGKRAARDAAATAGLGRAHPGGGGGRYSE